jgi:hypothetical protein
VNHICPICNGMAGLQAQCAACGHLLDDAGRLYDYYGDYSPYRPIDDGKQANGYPDLAQHLCIHVGWCPACRQEQLLAIHEWTDAELMTASPAPPSFFDSPR